MGMRSTHSRVDLALAPIARPPPHPAAIVAQLKLVHSPVAAHFDAVDAHHRWRYDTRTERKVAQDVGCAARDRFFRAGGSASGVSRVPNSTWLLACSIETHHHPKTHIGGMYRMYGLYGGTCVMCM